MNHRMSWILGVGLFAIACGDDGTPADGGSGSSGSGTEGTTGTTVTPTTMNPTTEAMTSAATTSGPDDTSTTAAVDSSGTESSTSASTGPAESSSSGAPPEDPAYPPCMPDADPVCPEPYDHCYGFFPDGYSACSQMCMDDAECPQPQSGDAPAVCAGPGGDECVLDCGGGATCPDGMECVDVAMGIMRCAWPAV